MKPVQSLAASLGTLMAADANFLAHATLACKVGLITAPFTPSLDLVYADLTISAATGLTPIAGVVGTQLESVDPVSGAISVEFKTPAGGFRWETPGGFTGPTTVYGFALFNNAATTLFATEKLPAEITLTGANQAITAPPLKINIDPNQIY